MKKKGGFMFIKDEKLKAVYSTDLEKVLDKIGKLDQFKNDQITCRYCHAIIRQSNLYALIPVESDVEFCCAAPECVLSLTKEAKS